MTDKTQVLMVLLRDYAAQIIKYVIRNCVNDGWTLEENGIVNERELFMLLGLSRLISIMKSTTSNFMRKHGI